MNDSASMHPGVQHAILKMKIDLAEMQADLVELRMGLDRELFVEKQQAENWRGEPEVRPQVCIVTCMANSFR
jgi:hypothetical protein